MTGRRMKEKRRLVRGLAASSIGIVAALTSLARAQPARPLVKGPEHGALVIVGGGRVGPEILRRFFELAGGKDAPLVVIPTAGGAETYAPDWAGLKIFKEFGATNITLLHTIDRKVADTDDFVKPLITARAVWFTGGRQWRLVDSYLHTRTQQEVERVLERGGVVGGSSAGASIQASYLVRGAREGNTIMMAPGYEEGFGLLKGAAIDQHMLTRNRQDDLEEVVARHPEVLGISIDESTAIVVQGQQFEVIGASKVAVHDGLAVKGAQERNGKKYFFVGPGEKYDLTTLQRIKPQRTTEGISRRRFRSVEGDEVHRFRGLRADLTQHRRHLPAMIAGVIDDMLQHLPEGGRARLTAEQLVLDDAAEAVLSETLDKGAHLPFVRGPCGADRREIREFPGIQKYRRRVALPARVPRPFGRVDVDQGVADRAEAVSQVARVLLRRQRLERRE